MRFPEGMLACSAERAIREGIADLKRAAAEAPTAHEVQRLTELYGDLFRLMDTLSAALWEAEVKFYPKG